MSHAVAEEIVAEVQAVEGEPVPVSKRTPGHIAQLRSRFDRFKVKLPDPNLQRDLSHGWMLPMLLHLDEWLWGRWDYWADLYAATELPEQPIPHLELLSAPHPGTRKMLEASLDCIPRHGSWQTWGSWQYVSYFLEWLLFGFGHKGQKELPVEPVGCEGASMRLYQVFALDAMLLWPHDYFGSLLADSSYGKAQGFYPTPHPICEFMTQMTFDGSRDHRSETMLDPCVGTGRFLLHASNYTLRLYGMDIDGTLCQATLVNGYLYSPWMVRPIPWLDRELACLEHSSNDVETLAATECAAALADCMAEAAPPHAQSYLTGTEHDSETQSRFSPLLKRKRGSKVPDPTQGSLF